MAYLGPARALSGRTSTSTGTISDSQYCMREHKAVSTQYLEDVELACAKDPSPGLFARLTGVSSQTPQSSLEIRFLELVSGQYGESLERLRCEAECIFKHFRASIPGRWQNGFDRILHQSVLAANKDAYTKFLTLSCGVMDVFAPNVSIVEMIELLQEKQMLDGDPKMSIDPFAQNILFSTIGWSTMLFTPSHPKDNGPLKDFRVVMQSNAAQLELKIPVSKACRPLREMLRTLDSILPVASAPSTHQYAADSTSRLETTAQVSYLNVAAMKQLAGMRIKWVDSVSEHLKFDPSEPSICIFKLPSFCRIQASDESILSLLLNDFHEEDEKPCEAFSMTKLMAEVILSYPLLFRDDKRARRLYKHSERSNACIAPPSSAGNSGVEVDPVLDECCRTRRLKASSAFENPQRHSYDLDKCFPILKQRILRIQGFMSGISPNGFWSLWRDRRDTRLWYTIWAALIIGFITVLEQTISMALTAAQVSLAVQANNIASGAAAPG